MNTITAYVDEVIGKPLYCKDEFDGKEYECWTVRVKYSDMGGQNEKELIFKTEEEAKKVKKGYKFSH